MEQKRSNFTGSLGFILAAAGSAVGLGNLWRFPYLAAKHGGGMFLLVYIIFAISFGFVMMVTEIAVGRKTRLSPMAAFGSLSKKWGWLGKLATIIPMIILPYYCLIGGWVTRFLGTMVTGDLVASADGGNYFVGFISDLWTPLITFGIFLLATTVIVLLGVNKGIEKLSRVLMPALVVIIIALTVVVLVQPGALEGVKYYLMPNIEDLSGKTILAALGQLFFSMSLAMGIMITYGSYLEDNQHIEKATRHIELFDTAIAMLAGLLIVPAVFVFSGGDPAALNKGPSLMFITLPQVFNSMGPVLGTVVGALFFILVLFAAITSSVSIMEAIVSGMVDKYPKLSRTKAIIICFIYALIIGVLCSLGYSVLSGVTIVPGMDILDSLDFLSNSVLMPIVGLFTCIFVGFVIKPQAIIDEIEKNGKFKMKGFYKFMIKWIAPIGIIAILVSSVLEAFGVISY